MRYILLSEAEILTSPESIYVGSIFNDRADSMGCLLEDGTFLTTLHSIYDPNNHQYDALENTLVYFVRGKEVFRYKIKHIIHDGTDVIKAYGDRALTWDYARLMLEGDPIAELGPGFRFPLVEDIEMPFIDESTNPAYTVALSGPIFKQTTAGSCSYRHSSTSSNDAAQAGPMSYVQAGDHITGLGLSGQAVVSRTNRTLYAIHCGVDTLAGKTRGFIVTEYLRTLETLHNVNHPRTSAPLPPMFFPGFVPEANERRQRRIDALRGQNNGNAETDNRFERFAHETYDLRTVVEITNHFPKLGRGAFSCPAIKYTDTKIVYRNIRTGWCITYDSYGKYSTVQNERGHYVDWNGGRNPDGRGNDARFHFYDSVPIPIPGRPQPHCRIPGF